MILVLGATGMFGGRIARGLLEAGQPVRALVHNRDKGGDLEAAGAELAVADLDRPETLAPALEGIARVFLVSPMDDRIAVRETAVIAKAQDAGVDLVIKLFGAVRHHDDPLAAGHGASIEALRASGLRWALLSPNSVMETSLLPLARPISTTGQTYGCAGDGKVGLIAADDAAAAGVALLVGAPEAGRDYQVTGPEALSCADVDAILSNALGTTVGYVDMPEDAFRDVLVRYAGMTAEQAEVGVVAHYRAWRQGGADLVTDTVRELTGREPISVEDWVQQHLDAFRSPAA
jgi:uncharacterized protein YbjT (DUF2867 family)